MKRFSWKRFSALSNQFQLLLVSSVRAAYLAVMPPRLITRNSTLNKMSYEFNICLVIILPKYIFHIYSRAG